MAGYTPVDPFEGLIKGQDYVSGLFDQHARLQAGRAYANGDTTGAARLLAARGMIADAGKLQDQQTATDSLTALDSGDYAGATAAAAKGGDPALYGQVSGAAQAEKAARAQWLGHAADALLQIKDPTARQQAFDSQIVPVMKSMGIPEASISQIEAGHLTDENLRAFQASLGQMVDLDIHTDAMGNIVGTNKKTGVASVLYQSPQRPVSVGGDLVDGVTGKPLYIGARNVAEGSISVPGHLAGEAPSGGEPAPASGALDGSQFFKDFVIKHEGGLNPHDANGAPTNYGINQTANPGVDVHTLTPDTAAKIFMDKYYGPSGAEHLPPALAAVHADTYFINPARATQFLAQSGGDPQKYMDLRAAWMDHLVATDPGKYGKYDHAWTTRNADLRAYAQQAASGKAGAVVPPPPGASSGTISNPKPDEDLELSPDALDMSAQGYVASGIMPSVGQGKVGSRNRAAILNRAAEIEKQTGVTGAEAVARWQELKVNAANLKEATTQRSRIETFENTALRNGQLALQLSRKVSKTGSPVLNAWVMGGQKAVLGDPDVNNFNIALGTYADEYAKIMSGGSLGSPSTDSARAEAYSRLSKFASQGQLEGGMATMNREMENRRVELRARESEAQAAMRRSAPPAASAPAAPSAPTDPQHAAAMQFKGSTAVGGSRQNPFTPKTQAQYQNLKPGSWFIDSDGTLVKKGAQ